MAVIVLIEGIAAPEQKVIVQIHHAQLRVKHVRKLRVIDASIMPSLPSCNTNGPTIMIAEKGAALLLGS